MAVTTVTTTATTIVTHGHNDRNNDGRNDHNNNDRDVDGHENDGRDDRDNTAVMTATTTAMTATVTAATMATATAAWNPTPAPGPSDDTASSLMPPISSCTRRSLQLQVFSDAGAVDARYDGAVETRGCDPGCGGARARQLCRCTSRTLAAAMHERDAASGDAQVGASCGDTSVGCWLWRHRWDNGCGNTRAGHRQR
jgi:hypothetical protein